MAENTNPLGKYYRQPQIYIGLPSGEQWYGPDAIVKTQTGEHAVLPMTAKDEIAFKTPDALLNGQAVVDVIKSCIPDIMDPWQIVNYDLDTVLVAIRIATYGETMDISFKIPGTTIDVSHTINLPQVLDSIKQVAMINETKLSNGMTIKVKPLNYRDITKSQLQTFQQQKMYNAVLDSNLSEEEKIKKFNDSFTALTTLSDDILMSNIEYIETPNGERVSDRTQIAQFIKNANAKLMRELGDRLVELRTQGSVKPVRLKSTEEQIKAGAPVSYEVPITFDNANFFV